MRRPIFMAKVLAILLAIGLNSSAQNSLSDLLGAPGADLSDPGRRAQVVAEAGALMAQRQAAARTLAVQRGFPLRMVQPAGRILEIADFDGDQPVYFTTHNVNAAISTGANLLQAAPYSVTGSGWTVGLWDGGSARATHQEFGGRVTVKDGAAAADHSTHVGGTIAAAGAVAAAKGMAPAVLVDSYEWTSDKSEMTSRGASYPGEPGKIQISNHSYGFISGWNYTGKVTPRWDWWGSGTTSTSIEDDFGKYEVNARDTDSIEVSLPYYLIFRSAGNQRQDNPAPGESVALTPNGTTAVSYNTALHPAGDGVYKGGGYDTISFDAVAKNVVTIGSVGDAVNGGLRYLPNATMSSYSSWGPTDDGRIKPDLVANGEGLTSSLAGSDASYGIYSGTSMATPNAVGSAALLLQWWDQLFPGQVLRASTLKGLLIHTADDLGTPGPDYRFGWGLINVKAAADLMQAYKNSPGTRRIIEDRLTTNLITRSCSFTWDGSSPLRATLCWTDPAGVATTNSDLRSAQLVNNLNLQINGPSGTLHLPWVMPYVGDWTIAQLSAAATTGTNNTDPVEQVFIAAPPAPGVYTAVVTFTGTLSTGVQNFGLLLSGGTPVATVPAPTATMLSPNSGTSGTMTLSLTGTGFLPGATVKLTKTGQPDVAGTGREITSDLAKFRVGVTGLAAGFWSAVLTNPDGQSVTLPNAFSIAGPLWFSDLESGTTGWSNSASLGSTAWTLTTAQSHSSTHSFFAPGPSTKNLDDLYSPSIAIPAGTSNLQLTFWHNYNLQSARDGGVLEFSVDGGAWFDVVTNGSGAVFATGGYNSTLSTSGNPNSLNPLAGRQVWSGVVSSFTQVAVNLTNAVKFAGKSLRIRWRLATNNGTASTGWYVDDVSLAGAAAQANLPPSITTPASATLSPVTNLTTQLAVEAGDDAGEPALTYTWSATGGSFLRPVGFSENGVNAAKLTTATFGVAGSYSFTVMVRDAEGLTASSTSAEVIVGQTATNLAVAPGSTSIGKGATQAFAATVLDQFGDPLAPQPATNWSTTGGGTITADGTFTATTVGGPFTITAASGGFSNTASVTVTGQTLAAWRAAYFSPAEITAGLAADLADPEGDGLSNLGEYALGTDPRTTTSQPAFAYDADGLTITFTRPKSLPDVTYAAESSDGLGVWTALPIELLTDGDPQTVRARDPLTSGDPTRRFIRLRFMR